MKKVQQSRASACSPWPHRGSAWGSFSCCPPGLTRRPEDQSPRQRFGLSQRIVPACPGALEIQQRGFLSGAEAVPWMAPARHKGQILPRSSHYTNPKTGRFKSGDATQYSVLFVCL